MLYTENSNPDYMYVDEAFMGMFIADILVDDSEGYQLAENFPAVTASDDWFEMDK